MMDTVARVSMAVTAPPMAAGLQANRFMCRGVARPFHDALVYGRRIVQHVARGCGGKGSQEDRSLEDEARRTV